MVDKWLRKGLRFVFGWLYGFIFCVGLLSIYRYTDREYPELYSWFMIVFYSVFGAWCFWDVILKNFIIGYRVSKAESERTE